MEPPKNVYANQLFIISGKHGKVYLSVHLAHHVHLVHETCNEVALSFTDFCSK